MKVEPTKKIENYYCKLCGWEVPKEIINLITCKNDIVFCELCGQKIVKEDFINPENLQQRTSVPNFGFEFSPEQLEQRKKYPNPRVIYDEEFPELFKENLILVISRLTYFYLKSISFNIEKAGFNQEILDEISEFLIPITTNKIDDQFLSGLHGITKDDFETKLKKLQCKVSENVQYKKDFRLYLRWLIKELFIIIFNKWESNDLSKFERIIRDDLKAFFTDKIKIIDINTNDDKDNQTNLSQYEITNSFRGKLYHKLKEITYNLIKTQNLSHMDFDKDFYIELILDKLKIPSNDEKINNSNIKDKATAKRRLINKKKYVSILGKIMIDILDLSQNNSISDVANKYQVSRDFVIKVLDYVSVNHQFLVENRFPTVTARGTGRLPSKKTIYYIKKYCLKFEDPNLLFHLSTEIFNDLIEGENSLKVDNLPIGFKTNPRYLAVSIVYLALRHRRYYSQYIKYDSYGIMSFIKEYYKSDTTKKLAIGNVVPKIYEFLSAKFKKDIKYQPIIKVIKQKYNREAFRKELCKLKEYYTQINRYDNAILLDLLLSTLNQYEKGRFQLFIQDLKFFTGKEKAWRIIKKLSVPNTLRGKSDLDSFISDYKKLINNLNCEIKIKENLVTLLIQFKKERYIFFNYDDSYREKRRREYERYLTYGKSFSLPSSRIKRFLLMLGFSPYDGFDIWDNKVKKGGKYKIFANFHHYHYNPVDQSENDLVFIPIKPPKRFRTTIYETTSFLSHNMIAGKEGHLKSPTISLKAKLKIRIHLQKIEAIIEHNSKILSEAVLKVDFKLLDNLVGWSKESILKAKMRLSDIDFNWANGIEKYIPLTKEYADKIISPNQVKKVIEKIQNIRKKYT